MPSGIFYLKSLDWSNSNRSGSGKFLLLPCFIEIPVFYVNSVDPDQTLHLIWVYTVCQCPFNGTLGLNGLRYIWHSHLMAKPETYTPV